MPNEPGHPSPAFEPQADSAPDGRVLSNGRYRVLATAAGAGGSMLEGTALTAWRGDPVVDGDGLFVYLRDRASGEFWAVGLQPTPGLAGSVSARAEPGRVTVGRRVDDLEATQEICVVPDATAELRRVTVHNRSGRRRRLELTSFAEVALQEPAAHAAHPGYSRLFVQTEAVALESGPAAVRVLAPPGLLVPPVLLARRRPRASGERHPWLVHALVLPAPGRRAAPTAVFGACEHETDRGRFLGRGGSLATPRALSSGATLSATTGNVLDPCVSLRCTFELEPQASASVVFVTGAAPEREAALELARRFGAAAQQGTPADPVAAAFAAAEQHEHARCAHLGLDTEQAQAFQGLAAAMLYGDPALRAASGVLARARGQPSDLHRYGVRAGRALAVLHAERPAGAALLPAMVRAHRYWLALGLPIDLLILAADAAVPLAGASEDIAKHPLVLRHADLPPADVDLLDAVARLVVVDALPARAAGAAFASTSRPAMPRITPSTGAGARVAASDSSPPPPRFFNGLGGFSEDGTEYVIQLRTDAQHPGALTIPPRPWTNVVANERFGFVISETGAGTTWSRNSREYRLTPWSNDSVLDPHGEALYVRDDTTGAIHSPLPGPVPARRGYELRHGFGYSRFEHDAGDGLHMRTTVFVPPRDSVKVTLLQLTNHGAAARRLSLFVYAQLVMGTLPQESGRFVLTERDAATGALLARNPLAGEFADSVVFSALAGPAQPGDARCSGDRRAFIGRNGDLAHPVALAQPEGLDGRVGAGLDPCVAQQLALQLPAGSTVEVAWLLGAATGAEEARTLIERLRVPGACQQALQDSIAGWTRLRGAIQIETPSPALDLMVNGWLAYQTVSCRLWGRTAFYQSGGAFGFRDQLQDAQALVLHRPELARAQLLLHAAHQFVEGDVLHWWHPPGDRGLRTRFADDLLWLPWVLAGYVKATGDWSVLEESAGFVAARPLLPGEDEAFLTPEPAGASADLYEHCCRALERSLAVGFGTHGLPLFGTGDWNDGMNRVGREGRGESVWMGFFLFDVLGEFLPLCERRGEPERVTRFRAQRVRLQNALADGGWDGRWYRRGYYDDGTPLGSQQGDECRIDALAQAWAVLSKAAPPARAAQAMDAVEEQLISEHDGLIRLLTPPFQDTPHDPGYIQGYVAGVRENGGQYTHAALWVVRAMAELRRRHRALPLLELLNPVNHARTAEQCARYQVEPYVMAADVYGAPPHVGRGGWTWYTGSSGWMLRVAVESVLGLSLSGGETLAIKPCVPDDWPRFSAVVTLNPPAAGSPTRYEIRVENPKRVAEQVLAATLDGAPVRVEEGAARVPIVRDGKVHRVEVTLGAAQARGEQSA